MLNIKWPKQITNEDLYSKTKEKPWSNIITEHSMARTGITTARKHARKNGTNRISTACGTTAGYTANNVVQCVKKQLNEINNTWEYASLLAPDHQKLGNVVNNFIKTCRTFYYSIYFVDTYIICAFYSHVNPLVYIVSAFKQKMRSKYYGMEVFLILCENVTVLKVLSF